MAHPVHTARARQATIHTGGPHRPQFIQAGPTRHPPVPLSCKTASYLYPFLSPAERPTKQSKRQTRKQRERRGDTAFPPERDDAGSEGNLRRRDDVELGIRPRRAPRHGDHHCLVARAAAVDAARASSAPAPARAAPRPASPCQERRRRRRRGGGARGGGRLARAAAAGAGGVAAARVEARGGRRRGRVSGRRLCRLRGERRDGAGAEPDRRRPGGAQGVRGSGLRLQLPRDPRAVRHAAGARALLLHEPAILGRAPAARQGGGGAGGCSGLASAAARRHQLEDLQPWRQPGRGEGEAQVLGAGGGVHRQALQLMLINGATTNLGTRRG